MRATLLGFGLLAAIGAGVATAVHAQVNQMGPTDARPPQFVAPAATSYDGMLLADGNDPFGAARKMQGAQFYATGGVPSAATRYADVPLSQAPNSAATDASADTTAAPQQADQKSAQPQTMYPAGGSRPMGWSTESPSLPPNRQRQNTPDGSNSASSPTGMKTLQQRLAAMRNSSAVSPTSADPRFTLDDAGTAMAASPTPALVPTAAAQSRMISQDSQLAPPPANIQVGPSPTSIMQTSGADSDAASRPVVSVASVPSGPVVGGPIGTSRRGTQPAPTPATAPAQAAPTPAAIESPTTTPRALAQPADNVFANQSPIIGVQTTGPRSITVGKEASFSVAATNAGEVAAQDVMVAVKIPEWTEVVAAKSANGSPVNLPSQRGEPLVWRLPRLEARSKEQLVIRLVPRESKPFDLAAQWTCSPVAQGMVEVKEPKLVMKLDGPSEVTYGQTQVYKLTISNPGNGDAEKVVLVLAPVDGGAGAPVRHEVGILKAGENKPVEMELSARQAGTLAIKALAVAEGNLRAEVNEEILVRRAGLKTSILGPELKFAGTPTVYNIVISNPGNAAADNISVAAVLPPGAKYVSSAGGKYIESQNKVVWNVANLRPGSEQELELRCTLAAPGANRVQVLATAATDLADSSATITNVEALADLKLEVTDPPGPLAVGEEMVYEVHIRNRGTKAAENVDVAGFFSHGVEPVNAQGGAHDLAPGQVVFKPIAAIPAGGEVVLRIKARADQPGNHVFRAEVNCASVGAKLASEQTTMFYGDRGPVRTAARPNSAPGQFTAPDGSAPSTMR
jgi:uncharacterized repeat protein (TIGR01451 family)